MRIKSMILLATLAALVLCGGGSAVAQIIYGQPTSGNLGVVYTNWKVTYEDDSETTLSQFAIPLTGFVPVRDNLDFSVYIASASNSMDFTGSDDDYSLGGMSDTRIQANHSFAEDQLLLSVGMSLPTGKKKLTLGEEWPVLQALSKNYLDFPVQRLGEGFGFNVLLGGAMMLGENVKGGAGLMYQYVGAYEPYEGVTDYDPGDVISANVGADIEGKNSVVSLDAIYTMYSDDTKDSKNTFKQSSQLDMRLAARYGNEKQTYSGIARYVMRGDNTTYDPATGDEISALKMFGDEFSLGGTVSFMFANQMYLAPTAELRAIAGNGESDANEIEGATVVSFGALLGKRVGEQFNLNGGFKYFTGSANGGDLSLSGYQMTLGLSATM